MNSKMIAVVLAIAATPAAAQTPHAWMGGPRVYLEPAPACDFFIPSPTKVPYYSTTQIRLSVRRWQILPHTWRSRGR